MNDFSFLIYKKDFGKIETVSYICKMRSIKIFLVIGFCLLFFSIEAQTQDAFRKEIPPYEMDGSDTLKVLVFRDIYIYPPKAFKNAAERKKYEKQIRDVKRTLPYAKMIYTTIIETYEYIMTLPTDEEREVHLKRMEQDLYDEYYPVFKKMSLSQGKLLIKLIDRECNQTSYDLVKAFMGSFRAGFWNVFAGLFGANLKSRWDPDGKDAATERIVEMVEMGLL